MRNKIKGRTIGNYSSYYLMEPNNILLKVFKSNQQYRVNYIQANVMLYTSVVSTF